MFRVTSWPAARRARDFLVVAARWSQRIGLPVGPSSSFCVCSTVTSATLARPTAGVPVPRTDRDGGARGSDTVTHTTGVPRHAPLRPGTPWPAHAGCSQARPPARLLAGPDSGNQRLSCHAVTPTSGPVNAPRPITRAQGPADCCTLPFPVWWVRVDTPEYHLLVLTAVLNFGVLKGIQTPHS